MENNKDSRNRSILLAQLIFDKDAKVSQWGRMIFNECWLSYEKQLSSTLMLLTPYTYINNPIEKK